MAEENFADLGKVEAISRLYEGTPFKAFDSAWFETSGKSYCTVKSRAFLEGMDFDLVYFPLKHLGYKCVVGVTGELYAEMSSPRCLTVVLGVSAKLDFAQIKDLWSGIVAAAKEHGYGKVDLDLVPSLNGLSISVSAMGETSLLTGKRRSSPKSMDLICVSNNLGAAYLGQQVLQKRLKLEDYRQLVGAYLKPDLNSGILAALEDAEIYPSMGYFITGGLADTVKKLVRDSGLGAKVYVDKIPFAGGTFDAGKALNVDPVSAAMNGGDDFCLLFTIPIAAHEKFRRDFQAFDVIGHLAKPEVGAVVVTPDGVELPMRAQGWKEEAE